MEKMSEKLYRILVEMSTKKPLKNKEDLKLALHKIITKEQKKRLSKKDTDLISECVDMLLIIDHIDPEILGKRGSDIAHKILATKNIEKGGNGATHRFKRIPKRSLTVVFSMVLLLTFSITAFTFGNRIVDMRKLLLKMPEKTVTEHNGNKIIYSSDMRNYDTIDEMAEAEEIDIVYPRKLPEGYEFDIINVVDMGDYLEIKINSTNQEQLIFSIITNYAVSSEDFMYEANDIQFNINYRNSLYEAYWFHNDNYYTLACENEQELLKIINTVK